MSSERQTLPPRLVCKREVDGAGDIRAHLYEVDAQPLARKHLSTRIGVSSDDLPKPRARTGNQRAGNGGDTRPDQRRRLYPVAID
jgi:hypothetical protein